MGPCSPPQHPAHEPCAKIWARRGEVGVHISCFWRTRPNEQMFLCLVFFSEPNLCVDIVSLEICPDLMSVDIRAMLLPTSAF